MKIGILVTGDNEAELRDEFGSFCDMTITLLKNCGLTAEFPVYDVCDGHFPEDLDECDGWAITGSPASAYENLPWIEPLKALIRQIAEAQQPLLGICFGHQIIALALGGEVQKADVGWGLGLHRYQATDSGEALFGRVRFAMNAIHQDQVTVLPEQSELLAASDFCPAAMLRYNGFGLTFQAHPEFLTGYMSSLLPALTPKSFSEAQADAGVASLDHTAVVETVDSLMPVIKRLFRS